MARKPNTPTPPDSTLTFRVDLELKLAFEDAARSNDRSASQVLREFMRQYIAKHQPKAQP